MDDVDFLEGDSMEAAYGATSDMFDDMVRADGGHSNAPPPNMSAEELLRATLESELDRYIAQVKTLWLPKKDKNGQSHRDYDKTANPFLFWEANKLKYPHLYEMAMK